MFSDSLSFDGLFFFFFENGFGRISGIFRCFLRYGRGWNGNILAGIGSIFTIKILKVII